MLANYHTHNHYCDGKEAPEAYVEKALKLGLNALGFSSHAPVSFENNYSLPMDKLDDYCSEIKSLKEQYKDQIDLFLALEADFIPNKTFDFAFLKDKCQLDYIIGSIHFVAHPSSEELWFIDGGNQDTWDQGLTKVFKQDIRAGVSAFYHQTNRMILEQKPQILGHFDKIKMHNKDRFFSQNDVWYQNLIQESLQVIKESAAVLEINTRGLYKGRSNELFPGIPVLKKAIAMGIPLMLNTDAHHPDELLGHYPEAIKMLEQAGIRELWHYSEKGWFSSGLY